jgi:hypothetical protein
MGHPAFTQPVSDARQKSSTRSGTVSSAAMVSVLGALAMINSANQASEGAGSSAKDHGCSGPERCDPVEPGGFARGFHRGGKPNPIVKLLDYRLKIRIEPCLDNARPIPIVGCSGLQSIRNQERQRQI